MDLPLITAPHPNAVAHRRTWLLMALAALLVLSFIGGIATGRALTHSNNRLDQLPPRAPAAVSAAGVGSSLSAAPVAITGTGPDLLEMAARTRAVRHVPITGTGFGLVQVANYGGIGR